MSEQRGQTIQIKESDIETVVALSRQISEFIDPHSEEEYRRRLTGVPHLVLVAFVENKSVGFKIGYERDGYFYSWMGDVLPGFRQMGIAKALADEQEAWAKKSGYTTITFKTRNSHKGMLIFALKNGFDIIGFEPSAHTPLHRILLRKQL